MQYPVLSNATTFIAKCNLLVVASRAQRVSLSTSNLYTSLMPPSLAQQNKQAALQTKHAHHQPSYRKAGVL